VASVEQNDQIALWENHQSFSRSLLVTTKGELRAAHCVWIESGTTLIAMDGRCMRQIINRSTGPIDILVCEATQKLSDRST
jgi:hypothetical protein